MGSVFLELSKRKGFHRRANSRDISGLMNYPISEYFHFRMKQISWSESIESGVVRMIASAGNRFMPKRDLSVARGASCFIFLIPLYDGLEPAELACVDHFILIGAFYTFLQPSH